MHCSGTLTPGDHRSLVDILLSRARVHPERCLFRFPAEMGNPSLTAADLDRRARSIAVHLLDLDLGGHPVCLFLPPGRLFIEAFFGCLYAGAIAVPLYPPTSKSRLARTQGVIANSGASHALTSAKMRSRLTDLMSKVDLGFQLDLHAADTLPEGADHWVRPADLDHEDSIAFVQYTSGSTGTPKGVMVGHDNLMANLAVIQQAFQTREEDVAVNWLPQYHDMGLIGTILQAVYAGFSSVLMPPIAFIRDPLGWLELIDRYRGTLCGGPNFAYEHCLRALDTTRIQNLDLSCWRVAFNGAEPIRADTLSHFSEAFGEVGFRRDAFFPCYGMAESTLFISGGSLADGPMVHAFARTGLERGASIVDSHDSVSLVSCGRPVLDQRFLVVDPERLSLCEPGKIGEIWTSGRSVGRGYWQRPEESARVFEAHLDDGRGPFLRTGDLGFLHEGELFVTGRLKDLIIIRGLNHYPQDIEASVGACHPALARGAAAAFSVTIEDEERLVVAQEVRRDHLSNLNQDEVIQAIRRAVAEGHELVVHAVLLLRPASIPKTSSGKIRRNACREGYLDGSLATVADDVMPLSEAEVAFELDRDALLNTPKHLRADLLVSFLSSLAGSILRIPGPLDPSRHLTAMGLDSMMAVSLQHRIDAAFGVALPITVFLEDGCVAALANLILARLEEAPVPLATPVDERGDFPLSFNQLSMWYLQELAPDNASNHISFAVKIGGALDADRVRQAFDLLLTRHDALRSTFHMYAQDPVQRVQPLPAHYFKLVDAGGWDEARLQDYLTEETIQPFDLRRGPLLRLRLLRLDDQTHVLAMVVHHIAVDFWSIQLMMDAFGRLYQPLLRGETPFVTAPSATYRDFVFRQRDDLAGTKGEAQRAFWSERLEGVPTVLGLPTDFARPPVQTYRGAAVRFALPAASVTGLRRLANEADCTLYTAFLTVFQALLFRYTGQVDFLVGSPTAGRDSARWEDLVGYFANPVALRADLKGNPSFRALLPRSRATVLGALAHANFPYQQLVELIAPERDPSRPALFQVMFALQKPSRLENSGDFILQRPGARIRLGGLEMETMALRHQVAQFDLTLTIVDTGDEGRDLEAMFEFNSDLFSATRVGHMADHFKALSAALVEAPDKAITLLPLLSDAERRDLLLDWNDTTAAYPKALCLHQLLELRAADAPDSPAVISGGVSLSYRELDRLATSMAARLQRLGVGPEVPVGIHAHRSTTMLAGIFAIFKAGGAYVPLDPVYPKDRLAFMFSDSGMPVVLVEPALVADLPEHSIEVLCLDDEADQDDFAAFSPVAVSSENLAYLIYTSGSTGKPKGVGILHRCVNNLIHSMAESYALRSDDVLVGVASISFDLSVLGLYLPLVVGACQVLATEEELHDGERLASLLDASNCTVMEATPSTWRMLVNSGWQGRPEMRIHAGGEAFPTDLARQLRPLGSSLINLYGPTEATVWCSVLDIDERLDRNAPVPVTIGPPIANSEIYILDPFMNPVPAGIPGELFIGGHGLARCYYRRPALTAEKFVPNPFSFVAGERLYRTGDLLRRLGDGTLEFMSRMDFQVKLRGYRIELGEIEAALDQHPSIAQAVAVVCEAQPGTSVLAAYVALTDRSLEEGALKAALATHLKAGLPEYMVPSVFVLMDALPLSGNGKVDRKALPAIDFSDTTAYVAPRSEIEERLVQIWGEVLGVSRLGVEDSFFRLGGHSLSATQLLFKVKQAFGIAVSLNDFYDAPSVAGLAAILEGRHIVSEDDLPQITPDPDSRFDPFDLTDIQQAYWMGRTDSFELGNVSTHVYVETESSVVDITRLQDAFRQLILRHDMMRAIITDAGRQVVLPEVPAYVIEVTDLRDEPEAVREQRLLEIRDALSHKVLPADTWPLFEVCATRLPDRFRLHLSFDALITDGWSLRLLARELAEHYAHPERNLPTPRLSFRDCVVSERSLERSVLYQRARAYWTDRLDSLPAAPDLPLACQPESITKPHFKRRHLCIPPRQWQRLQARAAGHGLTSSGLLLAAFSEVLAAWSKSPHFCLNLTLFSRPAIHPQIHEVVGDFTTLLLLAFDGAAGGSFLDRATALQEQLWRDMDHRFYGGVRVLRDLSRSQKSGGRATMPIVFTSLLGLDEAADRADASPLGDEVFAITQTPQVWLDHQVMERDGYLESNWDAIDALFPAGMLDDMFLVFRRLLSELADASEPWNRLGRPSLPDDLLAERRIANATEAPVAEVLLHELFLAQLQSRPEAQAVLSESRALTYAELYDWAEATAAELRRLGVRPNSLVAVSMVKGWEQVVAVMAILLAGAAYLPVDPSQPWDRRRRILEDGKVSLALVCDDQLAFPWPDGVSPMTLIEPSGSMPRSSASLQQPHDLAYVIFTSGSTGRPKGVAISHLAAANTLLDINRRFEVGPQDRVFALSSLSFDLSVFDVFGLLAAGGAMVLPNPDLSREPAHWVDLMSRFDVSIWNTVPALMQMLVEFLSGATSVPPALRLVMMSGDWIPVSLPMRIEALWPEIEVFSLGGATEASIWSIFYPIEQSDPDWVSIPYGKPLTNQSFHVLDEFLDPKPTWVPGRLFIGGYGLASCYWGDPEKTGQRFIIHPKSGERLYDTGDLGRYLPDGNIEFLGREDFQVKINGFRIELGEIETALLQHPEVSEALVNAVGNRNRHLDAYVVAKEGATALFRAEIIEEADASSYWDAVTSAGIEQARQVHWDTDKATFAGLWQDLETLYDHAVCCAFRDLGAWLNDGDGYDVDQFIDLFGVAPRYRKWLLRAFKALEQRGWLLRRGDVFVSVSALPVISLSSTCDHVRHVLADVLGFDVDVSQQIIFPATHLAEILVEKIHSAEIYASDETPMIYQKLFSHGNVLVRETMAAIVAHLPADKPLRIIEVGAGIGSTTVHILPQLPAERCTYLFTDISRYFFGKVKQAFEPFSFVHYDLLDLEQPIEPQGYAPHSFDVVVASNVLHVPRRIDACMRHIRSLLAPGGFLVVIEETSFARWFDLGMGLQIGFERFEDHDLRPDHPLLSREGWLKAAADAGFQKGMVFYEPDTIPDMIGFDAWVAQAPSSVQHFDPSSLRDHLLQRVPDYMVPTNFGLLDALPLTANGKVDRSALPLLGGTERSVTSDSFEEAHTANQKRIADIFAEILGLDQVGINDSFFEIGGDSLLATQVVSRIRESFGHDLSLRTLFQEATVAALAKIIDEAEVGGSHANTQIPILERSGDLPLSFAQKRMWFMGQLDGQSAAYNVPFTLLFSGPLQVDTMAANLDEIVARHEVLRTTFPTVGKEPVQIVHDRANTELALVDLSDMANELQEEMVARLATAEAVNLFDLAAGPLLRVTLLRRDLDTHVVLVTMHHIVADGWSIGVLIKEVAALYRASVLGMPSPLPPLPIQYVDFAAWQRNHLSGQVLEEQLSYWREALADVPLLHSLPTDRPRPEVQKFLGKMVRFEIDAETTTGLKRLGRQADATLFMTLQAVFVMLLSRISGSEDIVLGSAIANRHIRETEPLIGFFVNNLVLRTDLREDPNFPVLLGRVRETSLAAYAHQDLPFEKLVEELSPKRNLSYNPLFQIKFVLENAPMGDLELPAVTVTPLPVENATAKIDLTLFLQEVDGRLTGIFEYDSDLFDASTITRWKDHYLALLQAVLTDPGKAISAYSLVSESEETALMGAFTDDLEDDF